jgi:pimeloyl-ACP methyl ester carboxylesterase
MNQVTMSVVEQSLPERKVVQTPGGAVSYRETGNGPALFLLHGMNGNSRSWAQQLKAFADSHRVIAWDAPGYGLSDPVAPDADAYAAQAASLLEHLKVERTHVIGHSMGGVIAERFCARHLDRAVSLVLSGTHWGNAAPEGAPLAAKYARRLQELEEMPAEEYGKVRAGKMLPSSPQPEVFDLLAGVASEMRREGLLNGGQMVEKTDNRPFLPTLKLPVLIITGDRDPVVKPQRSEAMMEFLPSARAVSLTGVGHAAYLEAPDVFNQAVREFYKSIERT